MRELNWALDALTFKNNTLFGFGWAFHPEQMIDNAYIQVSFSPDDSAPAERIGIDAYKPRPDVAAAHPGQAYALLSGFVFLGSVHAGRKVISIELVCKLANGETRAVALPLPAEAPESRDGLLSSRWRYLSGLGVYVRRAWSLLRAGQWALLLEKTRRYINTQPQDQLQHPSDLAKLLDMPVSSYLSVIVDHDLGGGANHYRARHVDTWIANGGTALIFTHHLSSLTSVVIVKNQTSEKRLSVPDSSFFLEAVSKLRVKEVVYNTAVSLANPNAIAPLLIGIQKACGAKLRVLVHDFYLVCPSHFLIDQNGQYCDIPDIRQCASCLQNNSHGFVSLFPARDMHHWRGMWGAVLTAADEIIAFSNNSAHLLRKAYPNLPPDSIAIKPHRVKHLPAHIPKVSQRKRLHIGVLGQIGFHKGAKVVAALASEIKRRGIDAKITVLGSIEASCDKDVLVQTGSYRHDELPLLIERSEANVFLFPSICPETFSYVVQELMDMRLPVAAFNLGAPAERLATYDQSLILSTTSPDSLLTSLLAFHQKIYMND